jgi:hypothetical protein
MQALQGPIIETVSWRDTVTVNANELGNSERTTWEIKNGLRGENSGLDTSLMSLLKPSMRNCLHSHVVV